MLRAEVPAPIDKRRISFIMDAECSSVDSDGEFVDGACCYDVLRTERQPAGDGNCVYYD
jgi:hypothetical protein